MFKLETQQTKAAVAILVQIPHIIEESVSVRFEKHSVDIYFQAYEDDTKKDSAVHHYGSGFDLPVQYCPSGINCDESKFDVANWNMVVALAKNVPEYWYEQGQGQGQGEQEKDGRMGAFVPVPIDILKTRAYKRAPSSSSSSTTTTTTTTTTTNVKESNNGKTGSSVAKPSPIPPAKKTSNEKADLKVYADTMKNLEFSTSGLLFDLD